MGAVGTDKQRNDIAILSSKLDALSPLKVLSRGYSVVKDKDGKIVKDSALVTKVYCKPDSDTYFPNLDEAPDWELAEVVQSGEENGIRYEMCRYCKK